jgi:hypothetical protein
MVESKRLFGSRLRGETKTAYTILVENPRGKELVRDRGRDRRIRFKLILEKSVVRRDGGCG